MKKEIGFITRIICTPDGEIKDPGMTIVSTKQYDTQVFYPGVEKSLTFMNEEKTVVTQSDYSFQCREIFKYEIQGGKAKIVTKRTVDGERSFVENASTIKTGDAYTATLKFSIDKEERIYGLGQNEKGTYNYRNAKEYLYQNNMKIPIPVFLSSKGYAILFDCDCLMTYQEEGNEIRLTFDALDQIAYYLIVGDNFDTLISGIRQLTGKGILLPRWAFGYIQSKERYTSQEDILNTAKEFKNREIPVSCLVLDWKSWEEGKWGNKIVDKERFPNLRDMTNQLHEEDIAFMVSIWPNMNKGCENNQEMMEAGKLLANLSTYDAFDPEARALYWKQCEEELFKGGIDAWWCDSTEPFTPDWKGLEKPSEEVRYQMAKENLTRYFDARIASNYGLAHAKGIYEHQTETCQEKRVFNLTRSGSISIQQYGAVLWSGDIAATWDVFRNQIAEGLSICMSGIPYWTLDIGAFFVGSTKGFRRFSNVTEGEAPWFWHGLFEEGVEDKGYRELYTRWLQFGTYLPIMRSHGTDTPREPWNFGKPGDKYYDTIVKYIRYRYQMLPYTYSLAHQVETKDYTILRSLMFDFGYDNQVKDIAGEFMYGPAYLVCPVTEAMEYGPESTKIHRPYIWKVYLPEGTDWYHEKTKVLYQGGQTCEIEAPIDWQPVFIRAGSIIPLSMEERKDGIADTVEVYQGEDGEFTYYLDNGQDYSYQKGEYTAIEIHYNNQKKQLTLESAKGTYSYPQRFQVRYIKVDGSEIRTDITYSGSKVTYTLG